MNKAYRFRLYPNENQKEMFAKTFGCVRFIWNRMLEDKIAYYQENGKRLNNTPAQYKAQFEWLREVDSFALCNAQLDLQGAYASFFRTTKIGFPKFKSKRSGKSSYTTNNNAGQVRIEGKHIRLPKIGLVRVVQHRLIPETHKIKSCTITLAPSGKYYVSILTEYEWERPEPGLSTDNALGLDYSSPHFYVDSQGVEADYPRFYREAEERLALEQRKLSHMTKGGSNYRKQKRKVARIHEHISSQRKDWIHKRSTELTNDWDYICVEDINLRGMAGSLKLGKSTNDNGFGMFREILAYKLYERGKQLVKISKWFPSSKACHICGAIRDLTLKDREWVCECGEHHLRDLNAAINIRNEGIRIALA
jgi:putative transposase